MYDRLEKRHLGHENGDCEEVEVTVQDTLDWLEKGSAAKNEVEAETQPSTKAECGLKACSCTASSALAERSRWSSSEDGYGEASKGG
eukprot:5516969-Alexandrium_andersonii.AAC.1